MINNINMALRKGQTNSGSFKIGMIPKNKGKRSYKPKCLHCNILIDTSDKRNKFCNHTCSMKHRWKTGTMAHVLKIFKQNHGTHPKGYTNSGSFTFETCGGEKNVNWKGGITSLNDKLRSSSKFKIWREAVFLRDNFTCQNKKCKFCNNKIGVFLHPHHIKQLAFYPELAFDINNGITYCAEFHLKSNLHCVMQEEL